VSPGTRQSLHLIGMRWWHIPAILVLERELFGDEAWSPEMFWSELANPGAYYLIAEPIPGRIVELAAEPTAEPGAQRASPPQGYGGLAVAGPDAYIQTVGVARVAQRTGIGRRLMHALLDEALARGATACWLEVRADNSAAQQLYRTLGFADRGLRRGYYQPSGADALVMATELPTNRQRDRQR
jgi:[ribosomal protein S18]-alanine N-acetyltransferase